MTSMPSSPYVAQMQRWPVEAKSESEYEYHLRSVGPETIINPFQFEMVLISLWRVPYRVA